MLVISSLTRFSSVVFCFWKRAGRFDRCRVLYLSHIALILVLLFIIFVLPGTALSQTLAFPGAEGYGSYSKGGRGGDIMVISNLEDSGPGSLREAVEREGARTILFETGGIIDLKSPLVISNPFITIAGQTAPEPGITIRGERVQIQTNHVIVRFVRFRPGDYLQGKEVDWSSLDAVDIGLENSDEVHDIIFDHCSFSWAMDENIGIWHQSNNITIQNSMISEGLHYPRLHPKTGKALLIGLNADRISILKNLFAHNYQRNPYMNANGHLDFRNNIIYNGGDRIMRFNNAMGQLQTVNVVNNVLIQGPESKYMYEIYIRRTSNGIYNGKIFVKGNLSDQNPQFKDNNWRMVVDEETLSPFPGSARSSTEFPVENTQTLPPENLYNTLHSNIGATLPSRDQVDDRILHNVQLKEGRYIAQPSQLFGWPRLTETRQNMDPDNGWQRQYEIDLFNPAEANADYNGNGFTNLEEFLNKTDPYNDETEWKRIGNINETGLFTTFGDVNQSMGEETSLELEVNYPNPFNSTTNIPFTVKSTAFYELDILNSIGQRVARLANSTLVPGEYQYVWNADGFPSGVYFVKLTGQGYSKLQKVVLIK